MKGHQDDTVETENLDIYARLNVQMDALRIVNRYARTHQIPPRLTQMLEGMQMLSIRGINVSSHFAKTLQHSILHEKLLEDLD